MKSVEFLFFDYVSKDIVVVKIIFLYLTATMTSWKEPEGIVVSVGKYG